MQRSPGFVNNDGKISVGGIEWVVEQQTKSFATPEDQELLLKFRLAAPSRKKEYSFLFHHTVQHLFDFSLQFDLQQLLFLRLI